MGQKTQKNAENAKICVLLFDILENSACTGSGSPYFSGSKEFMRVVTSLGMAGTQPAMISVYGSDKLSLCGFGEEVVCRVRECLKKSGVLIRLEDDKPYKYVGKGYEFQFEEPKPWQMTGESALRVRLAFMLIFEECLKSKYRLIGSFETAGEVTDKPFFVMIPYNFDTKKSTVQSMFVSTCTQNRIILAGDVLNDDISQIQKLIQNMPGGVHQEGMLSIIDKAGYQISSWKVGWRLGSFIMWRCGWITLARV